MDIRDDDSQKGGSIWADMGFLAWLSLVLPVFFIVMGVGILAGFFFIDKYANIPDPIRLPAGIGLCLWGLIRIGLIFRRAFRQKRDEQRG